MQTEHWIAVSIGVFTVLGGLQALEYCYYIFTNPLKNTLTQNMKLWNRSMKLCEQNWLAA